MREVLSHIASLGVTVVWFVWGHAGIAPRLSELGPAPDSATAAEDVASGHAGDACPDGDRIPLLPDGRHAVMLNAYYLQEQAARALRDGEAQSTAVEEILSEAASLGVQLIRTNGHNDAPKKAGLTAIQTAPMQFDEVSFRGLDLVLHRAAHHDLKLVLTFGNYWNPYGGTRQYVAWAGLPNPVEGDARFFTDRGVIDHYKAYIRTLLNRRNTFDGTRYGDHPAVFGWELLNEPRGVGLDAEGNEMRAWVDEVAQLVKSLAPGHKVGTGEEGLDTSYAGYDEFFWKHQVRQEWLFRGGSSFRKNLESPYIDFGSVHLYPDGWMFPREHAAEAGERWISEHMAIARAFDKPLLIGEFGLRNRGGHFDKLGERRAIYNRWLACAHATGAGGIGPWLFANDDRPDWDDYTFYWTGGTDPADQAHLSKNRYVDLLQAAVQRSID